MYIILILLLVLYGYEFWSLALREEHVCFWVSENKMIVSKADFPKFATGTSLSDGVDARYQYQTTISICLLHC
jgi:hypothetical protein